MSRVTEVLGKQKSAVTNDNMEEERSYVSDTSEVSSVLDDGGEILVRQLSKAQFYVDFNKIRRLVKPRNHHTNIVKYYRIDDDETFYYLYVERCGATSVNLYDLVQEDSANFRPSEDAKNDGQCSSSAAVQLKERSESVTDSVRNSTLVLDNGYPSPLLLKLMREMLLGLVQLHDKLDIIHGELKLQNVLISKDINGDLCAKLSDIGIRKQKPRRTIGKYSYFPNQLEAGSDSGIYPKHNPSNVIAQGVSYQGVIYESVDAPNRWTQTTIQGPNYIGSFSSSRSRRVFVKGATDMEALGRIFAYCINGVPLFDNTKTVATKRGSSLSDCPEALDLYSSLLNQDLEDRPRAIEALRHPLFWNPEKKLRFLCDAYQRCDHRHAKLSNALNKTAQRVIVGKRNGSEEIVKTWDKRIHEDIYIYMNDHLKTRGDREYDCNSVLDLLRFIRNMVLDYRTFPTDVQVTVGSLHKDFYSYFESCFPYLLIEVYNAVRNCCGKEEYFSRYFSGDS